MAPNSIEKGLSVSSSVETSKLIVSQPAKLSELNDLLLSMENLDRKVSERTGEDKSGDMGSAGSAGSTTGTSGVSRRDDAIANIPSQVVMQQQIATHIQKEVKQLEKLARKTARSSVPGAAFHLNELYARIRRLNTLLSELFELSVEAVKRLFIRIFIDKQAVL